MSKVVFEGRMVADVTPHFTKSLIEKEMHIYLEI